MIGNCWRLSEAFELKKLSRRSLNFRLEKWLLNYPKKPLTDAKKSFRFFGFCELFSIMLRVVVSAQLDSSAFRQGKSGWFHVILTDANQCPQLGMIYETCKFERAKKLLQPRQPHEITIKSVINKIDSFRVAWSGTQAQYISKLPLWRNARSERGKAISRLN